MDKAIRALGLIALQKKFQANRKKLTSQNLLVIQMILNIFYHPMKLMRLIR